MTAPVVIETPADVLQPVMMSKQSNTFGNVVYESGQVLVDYSSPELTFKNHLVAFTFSGLLNINHLSDGLTSRRYTCGAGHFLIFPAGTSVQCHHREYVYDCLKLTPEAVSQAVGEVVDISQVELSTQFEQTDPLIQHILGQFTKGLDAESALDRLYVDSLTNSLILHLFQHYSVRKTVLPTYTDGLSRQQLRRAIDYIQAHLDQEIKLADIAALLGMSQYYFCRLFRQSTGISPYKYVIHQRLERAKTLLQDSQRRSIADIAFACGFSSQSHLCKHFRKLTGMPPKAYQKQC